MCRTVDHELSLTRYATSLVDPPFLVRMCGVPVTLTFPRRAWPGHCCYQAAEHLTDLYLVHRVQEEMFRRLGI